LSQGKHILLIEAKDEGHHLVYVNALVEAMKNQGHRVTVSLPEQGGATREKLLSHGCRWLEQVEWIPWVGGLGPAMLDAAAEIKEECEANEVFFACIDEWASGTLRRAALGLKPAKSLKGMISGIYVRPRPLDPECPPRGLSSWLKRRGWRQLDQEGWFRHILVLDERLPQHPERTFGTCQIMFMPEPNEEALALFPPQEEARQQLGLPTEAPVFLHYGLGTRRKGLHHVVAAWENLLNDCNAMLLVAGQPEPEFLAPLQKLEDAGRALLLNRYIGSEEERIIMAAADIVLMPYVNHYGSSNVLSRAAAADRMVLASDQGLIGYRVRQYALGVLCRHDDETSLGEAVRKLCQEDQKKLRARHSTNLSRYAASGKMENLARLFAPQP